MAKVEGWDWDVELHDLNHEWCRSVARAALTAAIDALPEQACFDITDETEKEWAKGDGPCWQPCLQRALRRALGLEGDQG